jgi:hypothetical protein
LSKAYERRKFFFDAAYDDYMVASGKGSPIAKGILAVCNPKQLLS